MLLFSVSMWLDLFDRLLKSAHPFDLLLAVAALALGARRGWLRKPSFMLALLILVLDVGVRLLPFFAGLPYQTRYLALITFAVAVLAGEGILLASRRLPAAHGIMARLGARRCLMVLLILTLALNLGKALNPPSSHDRGMEIPKAINESGASSGRILVTMLDDPRHAYYANALELKLKAGEDCLSDAVRCGDEFILPDLRNLRQIHLDWEGAPPAGVRVELLLKRTGLSGGKGWLVVHDGPASSEIEFSRRRCLGVRVTAAGARLKSVSGFTFPPWTIFRHGCGDDSERLLPIGLPSGLSNLGVAMRRLGPDPVFLLVGMSDAEFRALFIKAHAVGFTASARNPLQMVDKHDDNLKKRIFTEESAGVFPFVLLREVKDDKKRALALYRVIPASVKQPALTPETLEKDFALPLTNQTQCISPLCAPAPQRESNPRVNVGRQ